MLAPDGDMYEEMRDMWLAAQVMTRECGGFFRPSGRREDASTHH